MNAHLFHFLGVRHGERVWSISDEEEIHHAAKVLRITPGAQVLVSDGNGHRAEGVVVLVRKNNIEIEVTAESFYPQSPGHRIVAFGALKPGDVDEILPSLVELGLTHIHVLYQSNLAKHRVSQAVQDRWFRIIRSAYKQCKASYMPELRVFEQFDHYLRHDLSELLKDRSFSRWLLADSSLPIVQALSESTCHSAVALVGSEKGFDTSEEDLALRSGFQKVSLGPHVLRAKTAVLGAAFILSQIQAESRERQS